MQYFKIKMYSTCEAEQLTSIALILTHKQLEMHVCILKIVATDALVLKQAISIHNANLILHVLGQFYI